MAKPDILWIHSIFSRLEAASQVFLVDVSAENVSNWLCSRNLPCSRITSEIIHVEDEYDIFIFGTPNKWHMVSPSQRLPLTILEWTIKNEELAVNFRWNQMWIENDLLQGEHYSFLSDSASEKEILEQHSRTIETSNGTLAPFDDSAKQELIIFRPLTKAISLKHLLLHRTKKLDVKTEEWLELLEKAKEEGGDHVKRYKDNLQIWRKLSGLSFYLDFIENQKKKFAYKQKIKSAGGCIATELNAAAIVLLENDANSLPLQSKVDIRCRGCLVLPVLWLDTALEELALPIVTPCRLELPEMHQISKIRGFIFKISINDNETARVTLRDAITKKQGLILGEDYVWTSVPDREFVSDIVKEKFEHQRTYACAEESILQADFKPHVCLKTHYPLEIPNIDEKPLSDCTIFIVTEDEGTQTDVCKILNALGAKAIPLNVTDAKEIVMESVMIVTDTINKPLLENNFDIFNANSILEKSDGVEFCLWNHLFTDDPPCSSEKPCTSTMDPAKEQITQQDVVWTPNATQTATYEDIITTFIKGQLRSMSYVENTLEEFHHSTSVSNEVGQECVENKFVFVPPAYSESMHPWIFVGTWRGSSITTHIGNLRCMLNRLDLPTICIQHAAITDCDLYIDDTRSVSNERDCHFFPAVRLCWNKVDQNGKFWIERSILDAILHRPLKPSIICSPRVVLVTCSGVKKIKEYDDKNVLHMNTEIHAVNKQSPVLVQKDGQENIEYLVLTRKDGYVKMYERKTLSNKLIWKCIEDYRREASSHVSPPSLICEAHLKRFGSLDRCMVGQLYEHSNTEGGCFLSGCNFEPKYFIYSKRYAEQIQNKFAG